MASFDKLGELVDGYLNEPDNKNIKRIAIHVPGHKGDFFIIDSFSFTLQKLETFSLTLVFSLNAATKKGEKLLKRVTQIDCFKGFTVVTYKNKQNFSKEYSMDRVTIVNDVSCIINKLFAEVDVAAIDLELIRVTNWFTIQEDKL